jgi:molybdate transport system permease protein
MDWSALRVTLQLAFATTAILFVIGLPLAVWLSATKFRFRFVIEAVVALPLVLPPTVLGFYLLYATGPRSPLGSLFRDLTGTTLPFSFGGVLLASVLFNLPFAVRPFVAAVAAVDRRLIEAAWCLGVSRFEAFWRITFPLASRGILAGLVLTFAHAVGEFGVVLMVGGNIPGVTRTLSIAIYDDVQSLNYERAGTTALVLLGFSFAVLCLTQSLSRSGASA